MDYHHIPQLPFLPTAMPGENSWKSAEEYAQLARDRDAEQDAALKRVMRMGRWLSAIAFAGAVLMLYALRYWV